jgi:competence protein ComEA
MVRRSFISMFAALLVVGTAHPSLAQTAAKPKAVRAGKPSPASSTEVVNINTATAAQLSSLPGIGAKTADLIVQYRTKNGPFKKPEEIMNVRGVGEKSFLKLKSRLTVGNMKAE